MKKSNDNDEIMLLPIINSNLHQMSIQNIDLCKIRLSCLQCNKSSTNYAVNEKICEEASFSHDEKDCSLNCGIMYYRVR